MFNVHHFQKDLRPSQLRMEIYSNPGYYPYVHALTGTYTLNGIGQVGQHRSFDGMKTSLKGMTFRPPNPVVHKSVSATASSARVNIQQMIWGKLYTMYALYGDLAGFISNPDGFSSLPVVPGYSSSFYLAVQALADARSSQASLLTSLAELPETLDMFDRPIVKLDQMMKKLRPRKSLRLVGSIVDYSTSAWLQYRYGIMPLLGEIDTYRHVYKQRASTVAKLDKSSTSDGIQPVKTASGFIRQLNPGGIRVHGVDYRRTQGTWRATVYVMKNMALHSRLGMDASSIPLTLWEIVPYSFVVDWFLDIGTWMRASMPNPSVNVWSSTMSYKLTQEYQCYVKSAGLYDDNPNGPQAPVGTSYNQVTEAYQRFIGLPLTGGIPLLSWGLDSVKRKLDSLALATGRIRSGMNRRR